MYVSFRSSKIYYSSQGQGDPLVLLHGFLESSRIWEPFIPTWAVKRRVICIDLPGHGQSEVLDSVHSMELFAEVVHSLLKQLDLDRVNLLGHSMGGYVSLAYLDRYPDMVGKIILLNSSAAGDSKDRRENRDRAASLVKKNKVAFIGMAISNLLLPENYQVFKDYLKTMKHEAMGFPLKGIIGAINGMKNRSDRTEVLKNFQGEKYFLAGKSDHIVTIQEARKQAFASGADLLEFPGGHLSYLEAASELEEFVQLID